MERREEERAKGVMGVMRASRPSFRNSHERIAFAVHSAFLADGYSLSATGIPAFTADFTADSVPSQTPSEAAGHEEEARIDGWNAVDDEYAFIYLTPDGKDKVLVKCLTIGDKLAVNALKHGADQPVHLVVNVDEFVGDIMVSSYAAQFKDLKKLVKNLDAEILGKLSGASHSGSSRNDTSRSETNEEATRNRNDPHVTLGEPWGPTIHPSGVVVPLVYPAGGSDLFPGPGAGMYPSRCGFGGVGSMFIGPNDPSWFGGELRQPGLPRGQSGVPPGARLDPYGPPNVPGFEPGLFVRMASWMRDVDCCSWDRVICDQLTSDVIGLGLSCVWLRGIISSNSSLFYLRRLQSLNLAGNYFLDSRVLPEMTHLNISATSFGDTVPDEISQLSKLVSLNLSRNFLEMRNPTMRMLVANLTNLEELDLADSDMTAVTLTSLMNFSDFLTSG